MIRALHKAWSGYLDTGISPMLPSNEVRYVRASNGIVVIVGLLLFLQIPALIWLLPTTRYLLLSFTLFPVSWLLVPWLNSKKLYTAARLYFSFSCILLIATSAIQIGRDSDNHFFMISVFLGAFIIYPPRQMRYILLITIISAIAMVMLEIYFIDHQSLLDASPEFFRTARFLSILALFLIVFFLAMHHYKIVDKAEEQLEKEHQRSERLLLNILPASIAKRLKHETGIIADRFESATVLFADLSGFTALSSGMPPEKLVKVLNHLFTGFDQICKSYGLEKIKTIGDSYMLCGGIPEARTDHCEAVADCAIAMMELMQSEKVKELVSLSIRIGIHTGPVVAGIIGEQKFSYDLWGDTVNIASRMESHGELNRIQVSSEVYEELKNGFQFSNRGKIHVKGKGEMDTYFLEGRLHKSQMNKNKFEGTVQNV